MHPFTGARSYFPALVLLASLQPIVLGGVLNITNLHTTTTSISFTVHDAYSDGAVPKPPATITSCHGSWPAGTIPPDGWVTCAYPDFQWRVGADEAGTVEGWTGNPGEFGFSVRHMYEDHRLGNPPYDRTEVFGRVNANSTVLTCSTPPSRPPPSTPTPTPSPPSRTPSGFSTSWTTSTSWSSSWSSSWGSPPTGAPAGASDSYRRSEPKKYRRQQTGAGKVCDLKQGFVLNMPIYGQTL